MAVNRNAPVIELGVDAAVDAARSDAVYGQVVRARSGTASERREARRQAARNRLQIDLDPKLEKEVVQMAAGESVPVSQMAAYLMVCGLAAIKAGWANEPREFKRVSRSMRFEYILDFAKIEKEGVR